MSNSKNLKGRHWAFLIYPESAPKNWYDMLVETGCEIAVSPLHDKDSETEESEEMKKAHYHVIISYPNTTTYSNIKRIVDTFNSPIPQIIYSIKGAWRYFTHMDHPHKYQYDINEIKYINGFDIDSITVLTATQKYKIKKDIIKYIKDNKIRYYVQLLEKLMENYKMDDWVNVVLDNTLLFNSIII